MPMWIREYFSIAHRSPEDHLPAGSLVLIVWETLERSRHLLAQALRIAGEFLWHRAAQMHKGSRKHVNRHVSQDSF